MCAERVVEMADGYNNIATGTGPTPGAPQQAWRSGGATAGLFLIALGVAALAVQLVPGVAWWQLWPLLIVAGGFIQIVTPAPWRGWGLERVADGFGTVLFGLVLLGNTTGYIEWSMWLTFLSLWPALLIAAGVGIIGSSTGQAWIKVLGSMVVWAVLLYSAAIAVTGFAPLLPAFTLVIN